VRRAAGRALRSGTRCPTSNEKEGTTHLKCYKVRDAQKLQALADLVTPQLGTETGCKVSSRSVELCVPAVKTVQEAEVNGEPIVPAPGPGPAAAGDYICYKLACPKELAVPIRQIVNVPFL
jgi:hypothetical protein